MGNPSSVHSAGRDARHMLEQARKLAQYLDATDGQVVFTGGTEANNLAIAGAEKVFYSAVEHECVRAACAHLAGSSRDLPVTLDGICGSGKA